MPTLAHDLRFSSFCSLFIREEKNTGNEKVCKKKKNEVILIGSFLNL